MHDLLCCVSLYFFPLLLPPSLLSNCYFQSSEFRRYRYIYVWEWVGCTDVEGISPVSTEDNNLSSLQWECFSSEDLYKALEVWKMLSLTSYVMFDFQHNLLIFEMKWSIVVSVCCLLACSLIIHCCISPLIAYFRNEQVLNNPKHKVKVDKDCMDPVFHSFNLGAICTNIVPIDTQTKMH